MAQMPEAIILRKTEETKTGVTYCMADVKTNADRIRAMTDEELAEWFIKIQDDTADYIDGQYSRNLPATSESWALWLKSTVEADNG